MHLRRSVVLYILYKITVQLGVPDLSGCDGFLRLGGKRKENVNMLFLHFIYICEEWGKAVADMKDSGPTCTNGMRRLFYPEGVLQLFGLPFV